ncbi:unnamed protein product [Heterosigma akashiwo]
MNGRPNQAGLWLGVATHLKVYPIIYALPLGLHLLYQSSEYRWKSRNDADNTAQPTSLWQKFGQVD